ncbi:MAG: sigma-54 dependent transcriptional regulator [Desulfobacteraceae bacterium]
MKTDILIVDDEKDMARLIKRILESELECTAVMAFSAFDAVTVLEQQKFDLMLCDIKMPGMDGFQLLDHAKEFYPDVTIMMITAYGSIDMAVKAIKNGAFDFLSKPFDHDEIIFKVKNAINKTCRKEERKEFKKAEKVAFSKFIGESPAMERVYEKIAMVAESNVTILITGESGTGKDLMARSIHSLSPRKKKPFISVHCPAIPENILESELFGYKKGAFTNAVQDKPGLFQEACMGTIFLDEIGDVGPSIQTKLLRVLQEKEIKPLGSNKSVKVDVRIIASTNRDLSRKIEDGEFREDFFYRLNVVAIELPPLRDRVSDIPLISEYLVEKHCKALNKEEKKISARLMERFMAQPWPGNVRELENAIIQGILHCRSDTLTCSDISFDSQTMARDSFDVFSQDKIQNLPYKEVKEKVLTRFNQNYIHAMLSLTNGNVSKAARRCGLERQALQQIMKRFSISADDFR